MTSLSFKNFLRKTIYYIPNRLAIKRILDSNKPIKLEIGSGKRSGMEDWVFLDLYNKTADLRLDASKTLLFPDNSISKIYVSHLLEHFTPHQIRSMIKECYRIIKPGGAMSVSVPNAEIYLDAYNKSSQLPLDMYCKYDLTGLTYKARIDYVNYIAYMGGHHHYMFDKESLTIFLSEAGFKNIRIRGFDESLDSEERKHVSIYAEGKK